jgi:hypothetical protein
MLAVVQAGVLHAVEQLRVNKLFHAVHLDHDRLEGADTGGNDHRAGIEDSPRRGFQLKAGIAERLDFGDLLAEVELRLEVLDLLHELVHQFLRADDRVGRDVVDGLVWIELGALAAGSGQRVDQVGAHAQKAKLEYLEQAAGAGADDDDVSLDAHA